MTTAPFTARTSMTRRRVLGAALAAGAAVPLAAIAGPAWADPVPSRPETAHAARAQRPVPGGHGSNCT